MHTVSCFKLCSSYCPLFMNSIDQEIVYAVELTSALLESVF